MISTREKAECALEEVRRRRAVYPRLCRDESMPLERAQRQIKIMEAIADDYLRLMEARS